MAGYVLLFVSSFAGTWSGSVVADKSVALLMVLSQEGADVSGTFGRDLQTQWKITKSKIDGDTLTVEATPGSVLRLVLKLDGDKLAGAVFKDGRVVGAIRFERVGHEVYGQRSPTTS